MAGSPSCVSRMKRSGETRSRSGAKRVTARRRGLALAAAATSVGSSTWPSTAASTCRDSQPSERVHVQPSRISAIKTGRRRWGPGSIYGAHWPVSSSVPGTSDHAHSEARLHPPRREGHSVGRWVVMLHFFAVVCPQQQDQQGSWCRVAAMLAQMPLPADSRASAVLLYWPPSPAPGQPQAVATCSS